MHNKPKIISYFFDFKIGNKKGIDFVEICNGKETFFFFKDGTLLFLLVLLYLGKKRGLSEVLLSKRRFETIKEYLEKLEIDPHFKVDNVMYRYIWKRLKITHKEIEGIFNDSLIVNINGFEVKIDYVRGKCLSLKFKDGTRAKLSILAGSQTIERRLKFFKEKYNVENVENISITLEDLS